MTEPSSPHDTVPTIEVRLPSTGRHLGPAFAVLAGLAVGFAVLLLGGVLLRDLTPVVLGGVGMTLFGGYAAVPYVNQRPGVLRVHGSREAVVFRGATYTRTVGWAVIALFVLGPMMFFALLASGDALHAAPPIFWFIAVSALGLILGPRQMRGWRRAEVHLERGQVVVRAPFRRPYALRWEAVRPLEEGPRPLARTLARDHTPQALFTEQELDSDPVLVAQVVEFYRANPGQRAELADGRALGRIEAGDFRTAERAPGGTRGDREPLCVGVPWFRSGRASRGSAGGHDHSVQPSHDCPVVTECRRR